MKKKMDFATKAKLIYSGELIIIAVAFIVIAILKLTNVFKYNETRSLIFNWITIFGGTWVIADLIWAIVDKKRQKRICLLDKITPPCRTRDLPGYLFYDSRRSGNDQRPPW